MSKLLEITNLSVKYFTAKKSITALNSVSLTIPSNKYTLGLVGESGSGKTTLALSIMNLIEGSGRVIAGRVEYNGEDVLSMPPKRLLSYRWREVSMVFQSAMNSLSPVKTALSHIEEVIRVHEHVPRPIARERGLALLEEVGLDREQTNLYPHELSGGMKQRVVIAMALALCPKILIADEPTSALDVVTQKKILLILKENVLKMGLSLIFITHEITLLPGIVENIVVMYSGEIVEMGSLRDVFSSPLHPYTQNLIKSALTIDKNSIIDPNYRNEQPNNVANVGCKYARFCRFALSRCWQEKPCLRVVNGGRLVACHLY